MWRGVSQSGNLAECWGIAQKVGASRTGEVQITRPWQGPAQPAGTNVKGPTGGPVARSPCGTARATGSMAE